MTKKFKLNIVDIVIIALIVAAVALFCVKFIAAYSAGSDTVYHKVRLTFVCEEAPDYVLDYTHVGDSVYGPDVEMGLGTVTDIQIGDSVIYVETDDGSIVQTTKPGHSSIVITMELNGVTVNAHGVQTGGKDIIGPGHTITIHAGQGKYYGKISGIEVLS